MSRFWLEKFKKQVQLIRQQQANFPKDKKSWDRLCAPDIALGFLFLHLFVEAAVDELIEGILRNSGQLTRAENYRTKEKKNMHPREKIAFIFKEFCPNLSYKDFVDTLDKTQDFSSKRNKVVHLHDMSWTMRQISSDPFDYIETPFNFAKEVTFKNLENLYNKIPGLFEILKQVLERGSINKRFQLADRKKTTVVQFTYESNMFVSPKLPRFQDLGGG